MKNIYHIQDADRPMWVIAASWTEALNKWKAVIGPENDMKPEDVSEPQGIQLVCESGDLIC